MKILTVVGARPQFIKAAPVSAVLRREHSEFMIHTGQHYDENMSAVFFRELNLPEPDVNLGVGSGLHGAQTASMLNGIEQHIIDYAPDWVLLYGDTNSTLAGAIAASKLHVKIAHVESGLRSFNWTMPEEINRVLTDHTSDLLFCPTQTAMQNLANEGLAGRARLVGDVMVDALRMAEGRASEVDLSFLDGLQDDYFYLATLHRPANTDDRQTLQQIAMAFAALGEPIVLPIHPRLEAALDRHGINLPVNIKQIPPQSYLNMVALTKKAEVIITDSGGLQKEAYLLARPCITIRPETEWVETIESGWNRLAEPNFEAIGDAVEAALKEKPAAHDPNLYGDGEASGRIVAEMARHA